MAEKFSFGNESKHYAFAKWLMEHYHFKALEDDKRRIYLYDKDTGIYKSDADILIDRECLRELEAEASDNTAAYIRSIIAKATYEKRENFDALPNLVCVKNGILNLDTLELMPHSSSVLFFRHVPIEWQPDASCPLFQKALDTTFSPLHKSYLQQFLGYTLIPKNVFKVACLLLGIPNTGKSEIAEAIRKMYKGYTASLTLQDLADRFLPAELEGKIVNIRSEITPQDMKQWETFKSLVSVDIIPAQRKFGQPFQMENKSKFLFTSNSLPPITIQQGVYERFLVLVAAHDYYNSKDGDEEIGYKLGSEEELPGMLQFAVEGYKILRTNHGFYPRIKTSDTKIAYNAWTGDIVSKFVSSRLVVDLEYEMPKDIIYQAYRDFCFDAGEIPSVGDSFWRSMKDRIPFTQHQETVNRNSKRPWLTRGIKLNEPDNR